MSKVRVYELAKQLGVESKVVLAKLNELGEFVRSASSTIEAPVVRKLKEHFPASEPAEKAAPKKAAAKKAAPKKAAAQEAPSADPAAEKPAKPKADDKKSEAKKAAPKPGAKPGPKPAEDPASAEAEKPAPAAPAASSTPQPTPPTPGAIPKPRAPRPGNNPFASSQGMPRPRPRPRPGNSPFNPNAARNARPQAPRTGGPRPGAPRGGQPRPAGAGRPGPGRPQGADNRGFAPRQGGRPGQGGQQAPAVPGQPMPAPGGRPGGGRPGGPPGRRGGAGRGGTAGAFGRAGGRPARSRKSKRAKRQEFEEMREPSLGGVQVPRGNGSTPIRLPQGATINDFAERINADPAALITVLFHLGEMATATQSLDEDTFGTLGAELGYVIEMVSAEEEDRELLEAFDIDLAAEEAAETEEDLEPRPPVVTVMGHVDHGKTRLLDAIRQANVQAGEAGGITQHIGAYQAQVKHEGEMRKLTVIDTPGHEAFTAMRARGAEVTDIAILVVAADDGVMPQTVEALNHAQSAGVPIVVAVNKVDKPEANPDKIRQQLTEFNLVAEEYGGDTMFVDISALKRTGIDELLEAVLLTADAALELTANPDKDARGIAVEANLDKGRGSVATVLVQSGTLRIGDAIVAGTAHGRVRAMFDEHGNNVEAAGPARPVQVLGLTSVPQAGDTFLVAPDERTARQIAERREAAERAAQLAKRRKRISLEEFNDALQQGKVETLNLVLKGDVSGAVEALEDALMKIDVGSEVALRVIHRGVGAITQNDVNLATVDEAIIIGFNVKYAERVEDLAEREGVDVRFYSVIYQAIEDVEAALTGLLKPEYTEVELGRAEVRQTFRSSKVGTIAGSLVTSGIVKRNAKARILRGGEVLVEGLNISSLKRFKDDATEVREGYECGIGFAGHNDVKEEDIIVTYEMQEVPRIIKK